MSIELKLDAGAIEKMLFENEALKKQFEVMFNNAVAEVKRDGWRTHNPKLTPEAKQALDKALKEQVNDLMLSYKVTGEQLVVAAAEEAFNRVQTRAMSNIDDRISRKVSALVDGEINDRVEAAVAMALKIAAA
ncbi:hypothetical protein [Bradyrhizobium sp. th.b2]|uniref:hypothetical protein n=1 Tax=Bradyrhizobium sp. th-b2 TaxID=172088 RepID=UPI000410A6D1|nr:hypothetical protein [Bradyrhizobium sp. th.b2]